MTSEAGGVVSPGVSAGEAAAKLVYAMYRGPGATYYAEDLIKLADAIRAFPLPSTPTPQPGLEAAARWHEEQARDLQKMANDLSYAGNPVALTEKAAEHLEHAAAIRALAAPASGEAEVTEAQVARAVEAFLGNPNHGVDLRDALRAALLAAREAAP